MPPASFRLFALAGGLLGAPLVQAATFSQVLSPYLVTGAGTDAAGGTYVIGSPNPNPTDVLVTSALDVLPSTTFPHATGSVWNITVANGASFGFSGITGRTFGNPSGGSGMTMSITAQGSGQIFFENFSRLNTSFIYGGVITQNSGTLSLTGARFTNNTTTVNAASAAVGGAIFKAYGTLNLTDSSFTGNSITYSIGGKTAHGGAIYQNGGTTNLTVSTEKTSSFTGNTAQGLANSVHIASGTLNVATQGTGVLDMVDRMTGGTTADITNAGSTAAITKTGTGTWRLGGANVFTDTNAAYATTFRVNAGTLRLYGAGEATAVSGVTATAASISMSGTASTFAVENGAKLVAAGNNAISVTANTAANAIEFKASSSVDVLAGAQLALAGNTTLNNGAAFTFDFGSSAINSATTALITVNGTLTLATGATFVVDLNGFTAGDYQLISSTSSIVGSSAGVTNRFTSADLDNAVFSFSSDGRSLWVNVSAVPEPSSWAAIVGGLVLSCAMLRRRRNS